MMMTVEGAGVWSPFALGARRGDSLKPQTSTRQTQLPEASKWRKSESTRRRAGFDSRSSVLLRLERVFLARPKKVIGVTAAPSHASDSTHLLTYSPPQLPPGGYLRIHI